ncbi:MAG TPA: glycosyltransferase [Actinomycetota bacterium]|nr:glycosyltransferase [Actinomycetota bacterium]
MLYIISEFPQISQTYIKTELEAVAKDHDVAVIARKSPDLKYETDIDYKQIKDKDQIREAVEEYRPDVIHTHYMNQLKVIGPIAERLQIPFTVRAHSFDVLKPGEKGRDNFKEIEKGQMSNSVKVAVDYVNHELCLGALTFPFTRPFLEKQGMRSDKLIDCWPVVNVPAFEDRGPNGDAIMNTGACIPKKQMDDFIQLATKVPDRQFNLYALGYQVETIADVNAAAGNPVAIVPPVQPDEMPAEYKKHEWLVYTGSFEMATVGWPMAIAEAQASGCGVCMPNIRDDVREYVGEGAGFVYDSVDEVAKIVSQPVPDDVREAGFEQAKKSDINRHKHLLTDLWQKVAVPAG